MSSQGKWAGDLNIRSLVVWLTALLTLVPLFLYAYLGHFSRLMTSDDYGHFASALWLSFRHNFDDWRSFWNGSYSFYVFHDLLTPLDPARMPPIFPAMTILMWLVGLAWLISLVLRRLQLNRHTLPIAIALAALVVHASILSFHTLESIYWYSAIVRHTLPVGMMCLSLAIVLESADRLHSKLATAAAMVVTALICFVVGGFSELNVLILLVYLPLLVAGIYVFGVKRGRPHTLSLLAAGWCGSVISLLAQISAPGFANRMETSATSVPYANPARELPLLFAKILESSLEYVGHRGSLAGFLLLFTGGMVAMLLVYRPKRTDAEPRAISLRGGPLWLGLIVQLVFLPILWSYHSGPVEESGAATVLSMVPFCLNLVSISLYLLLLWRRNQLESALRHSQNRILELTAAMLLAVVLLLALPQLGTMHYTGSVYLFSSALVLLGILTGLLDSLVADKRSRRFRSFAGLSLALAALALALPLAIGHYGLGYIYVRSLAFSALMQVLPGLVLGAYIGCQIRCCCLLTASDSKLALRFIIPGLLIVLVITIGDMAAQTPLIPDFGSFAREWDARHERIIRLRDSGQSHIEIPPFSYDMSGYISASGQSFGSSHAYYYGVDSITVVE